jgi:hypothetical protein
LIAVSDNVSFIENNNEVINCFQFKICCLFQTFILGQKNLAPKIAAQHGINLIFYGENEVEYGNPRLIIQILRDKSYFILNI